jgi:transcriptional regulator with XRE-family HTH domain
VDRKERKRLAEAIQPARETRKWTQKELSRATGGIVSEGTIGNIERGEVVPQASNLVALLEALGIDAGDARAELTRSEWPGEIDVFRDLIALYLAKMDVDARHKEMEDLTIWLKSRSQA